jgi:D-sedoheptulose 7-phosphate isomerase
MWEMNTLNHDHEINTFFKKVSDTLNRLDRAGLNLFIEKILSTYRAGRTIFVFGNGGSGDTASHFCGDFNKGVSYGLEKRLKIICLNDNTSALTAIANDISYDDVFVEQLKNFVVADDLVIGISCSGNSINVIKALELANHAGAFTVAFCGYTGGTLKKVASLAVHAEIEDMEVCEDVHLVIMHCIKQIILAILHA